MNQSMPWMKLPHRQYMVSISRAALKPIERLAFLELAMYANTQPDRQLPDIDAALAGWAGMTTARWVKIKGRVLAEWTLVDGAWSLPDWFDLYSDDQQVGQPSGTPVTPKPTKRKPKESTPAEISAKRAEAAAASHAKRQANKLANLQNSELQNSKPELQKLQNGIAKIANGELQNSKTIANELQNEGGKGGDLDLDQDLDLKESVCVTPCAATVCDTDPLSFTRHTLSQTGFTVLEIPKQFASVAKQRNSQLTDADLDVIWSRLLDWSSKDEQADVKRNWFNTWIARINSDAAVTIANRLKHQDTPTATVVEAACYRTISTPVTTSTAQALTDEQQAEMQRNKSALLAKLAEDAA